MDSIALEGAHEDEWDEYRRSDEEVFAVTLKGTCIMSDQSDPPLVPDEGLDTKTVDASPSVYPSQVTCQPPHHFDQRALCHFLSYGAIDLLYLYPYSIFCTYFSFSLSLSLSLSLRVLTIFSCVHVTQEYHANRMFWKALRVLEPSIIAEVDKVRYCSSGSALCT